MKIAAMIAVCCAAGGLGRYYLSGWVHSLLGRGFPYGTLAVNVIGSLLIGVLMELSLRSTLLSDSWRIALTVGLLGGLTTFSTFSYETVRLVEYGQLPAAAAYLLLSVAVCLLCTWLGVSAVRALV